MESFFIIILGFGLGMLHAFDADHVMAVSGLVSSDSNSQSSSRFGKYSGLKSSIRFCSRWAIGHGAVLLFVAMAVYLFGMAIPVSLSHVAENLVGLMLVVIGFLVLRDLRKRKLHLHFHQHDGLPEHAHWHSHNDESERQGKMAHHHDHRAVIVGMVHGLAGSAPLLAVIPIVQLESAWLAVLYVLLFSIGVISAMLVFGGAIGILFKQLAELSDKFVQGLRMLLGIAAILFGFFLLRGVLGGALT